jgi:hypothetical protein
MKNKRHIEENEQVQEQKNEQYNNEQEMRRRERK